MKKFILLFPFCLGMMLAKNTDAQVHVNVNVNIGAQPQWGPVGYDHVDYYYMPDIDVYYYVPRQRFIYLDGNRWIFAASLPARYRSYDVYRGYKVVINEPEPYRRGDVYRERYGRYRDCYGQQVVIRDHHHKEGEEDQYDHPGRRGRGHAYGHRKHHNDEDD